MTLPTRKSLLAMWSVATEACVMKSPAATGRAASNECGEEPWSLDGRYHTGGTFAEPAILTRPTRRDHFRNFSRSHLHKTQINSLFPMLRAYCAMLMR